MDSLQIREFVSQLKPIIDIVEKKQLEQQGKRERGELFNVFDAFRIDHSELAWSSFLATLLDPNGIHGCGDVFLRHFPYIPKDFSTTTAKANIEVSIGEIDKKNDFESGGRIDILITDASKHAIIIENKIYAQDQYRQLYRYWKFATEVAKYEAPCMIYLTLNGHKPSPDSTKGLPDDAKYICMSYSHDIKRWLETCLKEISGEQKVTEIIKQFIQIIIKIGKEMKLDENIRMAIEHAFNIDGNIEKKIEILSGVAQNIPEVTNNVNLLLEQYQQDRFMEIISSSLPEAKETDPQSSGSYWCRKANIEYKGIKQIFVMHDWPQSLYCGVIFSQLDSPLWGKLEEKCDMQPDTHNNQCLLYSTELDNYDGVYECLKKVLEIIKQTK